MPSIYIKGISEPLKRVLEGLQIRTVLRPHRTLKQSLVHPKNTIPDMKKSSGLLHPDVGETERKLCKRVDENMRAVRMADLNVSAIAEHAWNAGHHVVK